jgi:stress-induced morphogen
MRDNLDLVKNLILEKMPEAHVEITDLTGTFDHLGVLVVSDEFKGKMIFQQHQMIMTILSNALKDKIHAVKIKTMTKEKFQESLS